MPDGSTPPRQQSGPLTYTDFINVPLGPSSKTSELQAGDFWDREFGNSGKILSIEPTPDEPNYYTVTYIDNNHSREYSYVSDTLWGEMCRPITLTPEQYLQMVDDLKNWCG